MNTPVTVIDYGIGNLSSITRAFETCGAQVLITDNADKIRHAQALVLPGVGAFEDGMKGLQSRDLISPIKDYAATGKPFLGICLGMQMLMEESEEFGIHKGLGLLPGRVVPIEKTTSTGQPHKIPHIGWNRLEKPTACPAWNGTLLESTPEGSSVYFVHSFTAAPADPKHRLADAYYHGRLISSAVYSGHIYGCQFHPEKSGPVGLKMILAFLKHAGETAHAR